MGVPAGRGASSCAGQVRLVDAHVRGTASLSGCTLATPDGYALLGDRLRVGGELYLRRVRCEGTVRMQNLDVGATVDCTGATLTRPQLRPDDTLRPSLDLRAATIGKDLVCIEGFAAAGGVQARVADVHKSVQFDDATLGTSGRTRYALNLYGLTTIDLLVRPAVPPAGAVRLAAARVGTFTDAEELWAAEGGVTVDGFDYQTIGDTRITDTRQRLDLLEQATGDYAPGPYEQLAAAYRPRGTRIWPSGCS